MRGRCCATLRAVNPENVGTTIACAPMRAAIVQAECAIISATSVPGSPERGASSVSAPRRMRSMTRTASMG